MSKRLLATCSLCQSGPALREATGMRMLTLGAQGVSSGVRPPLLPSNGTWPLLWGQDFVQLPSGKVFPSSACGVLLPCPCRTAPWPLRPSPPGQPQSSPRDRPPEPESQCPAPRARGSGCGVQVGGSHHLCSSPLLCCSQSSCSAFLHDFEVPSTQLIFPWV